METKQYPQLEEFRGSMWIRGVKSGITEFSQNLPAKIGEITKAKSVIDNPPNGPICPLYEALCYPLIKIIEEFFPPVPQCFDKLAQVATTCCFCFVTPRSQEAFCLLSIFYFIAYRPKFLLQQIDLSYIRTGQTIPPFMSRLSSLTFFLNMSRTVDSLNPSFKAICLRGVFFTC